jgi:thioredoxin reductase (NADPH)
MPCHCYAGISSFEPRKPLIEDIEFYEDKGIKYFIKIQKFRDKRVVIAGGGDSALD